MAKKPLNRSYFRYIFGAIIIGIIAAFIIYRLLLPSPIIKSISYFDNQVKINAASTIDEHFFWSVSYDVENFRIKVVNNTGAANFAPEIYQVIANPYTINRYIGSLVHSADSQVPLSVQVTQATQSPYVLQNTNSLKDFIANIQTVASSKNFVLGSDWKTQVTNIFNILDGKLGVVNTDKTRPNFFVAYILPLLPYIFFIIMFYFIWRSYRSSNSGAGGFFNPGKNQAIKITSDKRFSDVAGNIEVKEEIEEFVDYLRNPKKYASAGAKIPKGILLGGPPGTGKTLIAKATAGEANVPFFFISASNFVELYVGVGAKRVRELFKDARAEAPAIIFIDELDAIGRSRGSGIGGGNDEREQTLNQLLVEMDGMVENSGLLIIAATNRTDVLDPALMRPGRFDRTVIVNYPDIKEREEILKLHAKGKRISSSVQFSNVAKRTPGFSGAQLENVINEATLLSVREKTDVITNEQIDEAIDRVIGGPAKKNRVITETERTMVAYHEAGHAVVGVKMRAGAKVQKITIIPRGQAGGYNLILPEEEKYNSTKSELLATIATFMGGRASEEIQYGKNEISTGAANDIEKATKIARKMVTEYGMSSLGPIQYEENTGSPFLGRDYAKNTLFSSNVAHEIDIQVREIISKAYSQALEIIKNNLDLLELIKDTLLEKETIVAEEIDYLVKHMKPLETKEKEAVVKKPANQILEEVLSESKAKREQKEEKENSNNETNE
ncbi:ATP-dependent zinc metalloprotease FtsH [Mesomycoplasma hyorhinis]|uniref:ATP-dependent zinc metalloprotease FtsH n=1 Tax=Mesomycoplasma hyorhinis TaxID=2100 RepID=A0ABD6IDP6_MESHY|nr:ATP-dependent zinc metalloprotease FtsH [Mesomycoplasma hyorhinis]MXR11345.1 ATP-dependent zinc metalloprotease FtsH [Mesomycoplasma hyorhinis]MXR43449.1 ATP-dependent zinc metalloprotease FtsH [Mesomycoplasma hyorhinis]